VLLLNLGKKCEIGEQRRRCGAFDLVEFAQDDFDGLLIFFEDDASSV